MNKQELIERIEGLKNIFGNKCEYVKIDFMIELVSELDEPQKPVVPQFVADWYEKHKYALEFNIFDYVYRFEQKEKNDFKDWFDDINTKAIQILVNMHQFGYEVEKEPKYTVKFKATNQYLCDDDGIGLHISPSFRSNFRKSDLEKLSLTEVFDSPLFEVVEVE